ncbi:hypothetical protein [Microvirga zambiensis]|uniref:hypothetical protein n=1 Tax=Microvirga zambiensis TaxID=1402137 RepID=UPI00191CC6D4|nr:hypothetical protein [Microvirga zambiensis]
MGSFFITRPAPVARFEGGKTLAPIPVRSRAVFDTLILATLDPTVDALAPADPVVVRVGGQVLAHQPDVHLIAGGRVTVVDVPNPSRVAMEGPRYAAVAAAYAERGVAYERRRPPQVHGSPLLMNARAVWACRGATVSAPDQVRVLEALAGGPRPLAEAARAVPSGDGVVVCLALACRDLLEIDLTGAPLGPETPVKRRRHP